MEIGGAMILKYVLEILVLPALGFFMWMAKRIITRVEHLEDKVSELDKHTAVHESIIKEIQSDIRAMDRKLDKIIEKLYSRDGK